MVKRYPHTALLSYVAAGTTSTQGYLSEGTLTSISIICKIQPARGEATLTNDKGIIINYSWLIFTQPNDGFSSVPDASKLNFFDKDHVIKQLFEFQNHVEIKC